MRYVQRRFPEGGDAAECYGEVLFTVWRLRRRMPSDPQEARLWMFGVARMLLANGRRSFARRSAAVARLRDEMSTLKPPPPAPESLDVTLAIESLDPVDAEMIRLTYWEGFRSHEVASILGLTASTVRTRLQVSRGRLREQLAVEPEHSAPNRRN